MVAYYSLAILWKYAFSVQPVALRRITCRNFFWYSYFLGTDSRIGIFSVHCVAILRTECRYLFYNVVIRILSVQSVAIMRTECRSRCSRGYLRYRWSLTCRCLSYEWMHLAYTLSLYAWFSYHLGTDCRIGMLSVHCVAMSRTECRYLLNIFLPWRTECR
jgi:hypothetical protein